MILLLTTAITLASPKANFVTDLSNVTDVTGLFVTKQTSLPTGLLPCYGFSSRMYA
ncbi:hypothetical protein [Sulfuricurvum sp.]|uniref:hypothetical protein n=1 Tax=Sulfuricurvum sp. TaxID=2025608 RepID=UPI002605F6E8|nr:hypothetical protein [Sulfuricurvum sp.]MDD2784237.1 hypothetical protein [Sulfuricurvum sp.]